MNGYNDTDVSLRYRVTVNIIGLGERVDERLIPAGGDYGLRLADLLPASQYDGQNFNARVKMECNEGAVPCQMTIANWYGPIEPGRAPSLGVYDPSCRP